MHTLKPMLLLAAALWLAGNCPFALSAETLAPLGRVLDLNLGESQTVELSNGKRVLVKLIDLQETRDPIRDAVREAVVKLEVDGRNVELISGNYNLPKTVGNVKIDCPITKGYNSNGSPEFWGLDKDARLRLWPAGSPLVQPGTFGYPAKQRWFAGLTQMANEPVYVDGGERPQTKKIYYHSGLDIGGCEGMVEVIAATDGLVVSSGLEVLPEHRQDTPVSPRYDVVYLLDARGWYYRYSHLKEIDPTVKPGRHLKLGDRIGSLGKEGGSGGWSHLHFEIKSRQPSGRWGTEEGYAYLWEAYLRQFQPKVIAVARPHHVIWAGEQVKLDGAKSWSASGKLDYRWQSHDGAFGHGASAMRSYPQPGSYSEVLEVTDGEGNVAYDFAVVQVLDREHPDRIPPTIHPSYSPTEGIRAGDEVTFKVRTFRTTEGSEVWDFGDGTPTVEVHSDGNVRQLDPNGYAVTTHRFAKPGHYLVRVERANSYGMKAIGRLDVLVADRSAADGMMWVEPMKQVHTRFKGKPGTLALFGDSISVSLAFWSPLRGEPKNMPPEMAAAHKIVTVYQRPECWSEWRGPQYGNQGRMTIRWAHENVDAWLKAHDPEAAVLMFGTNDLGEVPLEEFERKTGEVVDRCLANGTVVLLTTLPPRSGMLEKSKQFAEAVRRVATAKQTPLIDYHAEVLKRRPEDWDGALPQFRGTPGSEYEVPTLIARDGVHPSNPQAHRDFSAESLKRNGFALRNYVTLVAYAEVVQKLFANNTKSPSESQ